VQANAGTAGLVGTGVGVGIGVGWVATTVGVLIGVPFVPGVAVPVPTGEAAAVTVEPIVAAVAPAVGVLECEPPPGDPLE